MGTYKKEDYVDFVIEHKGGQTKITVENGPTINCGDLPTEEVIKRLLGENVQGFGTPMTTDKGYTSDYYEQQAAQKQQYPVSSEETKPFIQRRKEQEQEKQQFDL